MLFSKNDFDEKIHSFYNNLNALIKENKNRSDKLKNNLVVTRALPKLLYLFITISLYLLLSNKIFELFITLNNGLMNKIFYYSLTSIFSIGIFFNIEALFYHMKRMGFSTLTYVLRSLLVVAFFITIGANISIKIILLISIIFLLNYIYLKIKEKKNLISFRKYKISLKEIELFYTKTAIYGNDDDSNILNAVCGMYSEKKIKIQGYKEYIFDFSVSNNIYSHLYLNKAVVSAKIKESFFKYDCKNNLFKIIPYFSLGEDRLYITIIVSFKDTNDMVINYDEMFNVIENNIKRPNIDIVKLFDEIEVDILKKIREKDLFYLVEKRDKLYQSKKSNFKKI